MLPIHAYKDIILQEVQKSQIVIIVAETGAGKSTQVCQYLREIGHRVIVTQPRRLAASTVSARVAEERGCRLGDEVGFKTARDSLVSRHTSILFCTDGYLLARELHRDKLDCDVLIIDEIHEGGIDAEVLMAWALRQIENGAKFKLVLMSASIDAERLSQYCNDAPIINVPGRTFPIVDRKPIRRGDEEPDDEVMARTIRQLVEDENRNVLVFLPGKREIAGMRVLLKGLDAEILDLHGEMTREDQQLAFKEYPRPKVILSTPIGQTSITVPDVTAVVDSCLANRNEAHNGIEGLYLRPISAADRLQRRGRAGRTQPGVYIPVGPEPTEKYPTPEIERALLDKIVLKMAVVGIDIEVLRLWNRPKSGDIKQSKETLRLFGCMDGDSVTELGSKIARLPVDPRFGVMLAYASRLGVLNEVTTIVACIGAGGIINTKIEDDYGRPVWRQYATEATASDCLTLLKIFDAGLKMRRQSWKENGISGRGMKEAIELRKQISEASAGAFEVTRGIKATPTNIIKSVVAGLIDQLRRKGTNGRGRTVFGEDMRFPSQDSSVDLYAEASKWVVGLPYTIPGKKGPVAIFQYISSVDVSWLVEMAPEMVRVERTEPFYDDLMDNTVQRELTYFRSTIVNDRLVTVSTSEPLINWILQSMERAEFLCPDDLQPLHRQWRKARKLSVQTGASLPDIREHVQCIVNGASSLHLIPEDAWSNIQLIDEVEVERINVLHPDSIEIAGRSCSVEYDCTPPRVTLPLGFRWQDLPDVITTPGGRQLAFELRVSWQTYVETDGAALRKRLAATEVRRRLDDDRFSYSTPRTIKNIPFSVGLTSVVEDQQPASVTDLASKFNRKR